MLSGRAPASSSSLVEQAPCRCRAAGGRVHDELGDPVVVEPRVAGEGAVAVPDEQVLPAPAGPPCWSRSSASSESGRTPSAAVAARSSARTSSTSRGSQVVAQLRPQTSSESAAVVGRRRPARRRRRVGHLLVELVADVADGADQRLVLDAELGPQPADVDVDRAGAAEVVVAPDLLQQLRAGEDPARVLGQVLQQLELLVGEVERAAAQLGGVAVLVDDELAGLGDAAVGAVRGCRGGQPAGGGPLQPGVDLGRAGGVEQDVVDAPVGRQRDQPALGQDGDQRGGDAGGGEQAAQRAGLDEVVAGVDEDDVPGVAVEQAGQLGGDHAHLVAEQPQRGQHLGRRLSCRGHEYESHVVSSRGRGRPMSSPDLRRRCRGERAG